MAPVDPFADVLTANADYSRTFSNAGMSGTAARGLLVLTCMDSRIAPLEALGLRAGDAKILRNAGGQVTPDVLTTIVLAAHLLGVRRVMVMPHTDCRMTKATDAELHQLLAKEGVDTRSLSFGTIADPDEALRRDVQRVLSSPYLPPGVVVGGFRYDVGSGTITTVVPAEPAARRN